VNSSCRRIPRIFHNLTSCCDDSSPLLPAVRPYAPTNVELFRIYLNIMKWRKYAQKLLASFNHIYNIHITTFALFAIPLTLTSTKHKYFYLYVNFYITQGSIKQLNTARNKSNSSVSPLSNIIHILTKNFHNLTERNTRHLLKNN